MNRTFDKKYKELEHNFNKASEELRDKPTFSWNDLEEAKATSLQLWEAFLIGFSVAFLLFFVAIIFILSNHR